MTKKSSQAQKSPSKPNSTRNSRSRQDSGRVATSDPPRSSRQAPPPPPPPPPAIPPSLPDAVHVFQDQALASSSLGPPERVPVCLSASASSIAAGQVPPRLLRSTAKDRASESNLGPPERVPIGLSAPASASPSEVQFPFPPSTPDSSPQMQYIFAALKRLSQQCEVLAAENQLLREAIVFVSSPDSSPQLQYIFAALKRLSQQCELLREAIVFVRSCGPPPVLLQPASAPSDGSSVDEGCGQHDPSPVQVPPTIADAKSGISAANLGINR